MPAMTFDPRFDEVRESQQVFRQLLDATAWPGKIIHLPATRVAPPALWPAALVQIARTLIDVQVTFAVHGNDGESLTGYLVVNTGARPVSLDTAGYVIAGQPLERLDVSSLFPGTLLEPDRGATLLLACDHLTDDAHRPGTPGAPNGARPAEHASSNGDLVVLMLSGRGIADGGRPLFVDRAVAMVLARIAEREDEYPLGIDLILADRAGRVVSLPRTTCWSKEAV